MVGKNKMYLKHLFGSIEQYSRAAKNGKTPVELERYKDSLLNELKKFPEIVDNQLDRFFCYKCELIEAEFARIPK